MMKRYEILDAGGVVVNTILAPTEFVEQKFSGRYRLVNEDTAAQDRELSLEDIYKLFADLELAALLTQAETDVSIKLILKKLEYRGAIKVNDPKFIAAVDLFIEKGIVNQARRDDILAGRPVESLGA